MLLAVSVILLTKTVPHWLLRASIKASMSPKLGYSQTCFSKKNTASYSRKTLCGWSIVKSCISQYFNSKPSCSKISVCNAKKKKSCNHNEAWQVWRLKQNTVHCANNLELQMIIKPPNFTLSHFNMKSQVGHMKIKSLVKYGSCDF